MKKALILLTLSFLLTSCFNKTEEKITLDKDAEKMIEEVLDMTNTWTTTNTWTDEKIEEVKTEEEVIEKMKQNESEKSVKEKEKEKVVVKENIKTEVENTNTWVKTETNVDKVTPEEEKEAENLLKDLLGSESEIDTAIKEVK